MIETHKWVRKELKAARFSLYVCENCGVIKHTSWMPGWPPTDEYFTPQGSVIETKIFEEPVCEEWQKLRHVEEIIES